MGTTNYYPKGLTPDQLQGLTEIIPTSEPKVGVVIGHGIGERNPGDQAGLEESSGWPGWGNIKTHADKNGVLQIYINTISEYQYGEYEFAVDWVLKRYPQLENNIWIFGHSLGSYGAGKNPLKKLEFAKKIAGWIDSASGNFGDIPEVFKNLVDAEVRFLGVTAVNDTASGTNPIAVTRVYDKMKALNPNAPAILILFPASEWPNDYPTTNPTGSKKAHNAVLNRITSVPMYYSGGNIGKIAKGAEGQPFLMNLYEFMISNPRGSIFQPPTLAFTGPKYKEEPAPLPVPDPVPLPDPDPTPTAPVYLSKIYIEGAATAKNLLAEIIWSDAKKEIIKAPTGVTIQYMIPEVIEGKKALRVKFSNKSTSTVYGPERK